MKKILTLILIALLSFSTTFAYTQTQLNSKKANYKILIKSKVWSRLANISESKLQKVLVLVDDLVEKYKNKTTLSDTKKLQKIAILLAFKEIVSEKLEDDFSDVSSILNTVDKQVEVIIISDKRCWEQCNTTQLINQLREIPSLNTVKITEYDFSQELAKRLLSDAWITKLPAALFTDDNVKELSSYLKSTWSKKHYSLELGSRFNPYEERSTRGFKLLDKKNLWEIKAWSYIKGNQNAEILWLEYSDMECPFCAKLHNSWTPKELEKKYWSKLAYSLQHFPLDFHPNAFTAAQYLECTWKLKWTEAFYSLEDQMFASKDVSEPFIIEAVREMWITNKQIVDCVDSKEFDAKITAQQKRGTSVFGITWTPGNVLINTKTWEYDVINWAYPTASFVEVIDRLLK